jgi:hypothetical protein
MTHNTETEIPNAQQIVEAANAAIDEAVKSFPGAGVYARTTADRESVLCYLLRAVYVAGMTAETVRQHEKHVSDAREQS